MRGLPACFRACLVTHCTGLQDYDDCLSELVASEIDLIGLSNFEARAVLAFIFYMMLYAYNGEFDKFLQL